MKACQPRVQGQLTYLCLRAVASLFFACLSKDLFAEQGFFLTLLICFPFCNQLTDFKIAYFKTHTKALLHTTLFFVVQADVCLKCHQKQSQKSSTQMNMATQW